MGRSKRVAARHQDHRVADKERDSDTYATFRRDECARKDDRDELASHRTRDVSRLTPSVLPTGRITHVEDCCAAGFPRGL